MSEAPVAHPAEHDQGMSPLQAEMALFTRDPLLGTDQLSPYTPHYILDTQRPISSAVNLGLGVTQELVSVVNAGASHFGVVRVRERGQLEPEYIVTKFDEERAEIVGFIGNEPLIVGRSEQPADDATLSRQHFSIKRLQGSVVVEDMGSTNGTSMTRSLGTEGKHPEHAVALGAMHHEKKSAKAGQAFKYWASKSATLKKYLSAQRDLNGIRGYFGSLKTYSEFESDVHLGLFKRAERIISHNPEKARPVNEIITKNSLDGVPIQPVLGKYAFYDVFLKADRFLAIFENNERVARELVQNKIAGFHASSSASIVGVLRQGLVSSRELQEKGIPVVSGERTYTRKGGHSTISFADWRASGTLDYYKQGGEELTAAILREHADELSKSVQQNDSGYSEDHPFLVNGADVARDRYAIAERLESNPYSLEAQLIVANFPVAYGISLDDFSLSADILSAQKMYRADFQPSISPTTVSDVKGEFVFVGDKISPEKIRMIAVPEGKIEQIKNVVSAFKLDIKVVAIEPLVLPYDEYDAKTDAFVPTKPAVFI